MDKIDLADLKTPSADEKAKAVVNGTIFKAFTNATFDVEPGCVVFPTPPIVVQLPPFSEAAEEVATHSRGSARRGSKATGDTAIAIYVLIRSPTSRVQVRVSHLCGLSGDATRGEVDDQRLE